MPSAAPHTGTACLTPRGRGSRSIAAAALTWLSGFGEKDKETTGVCHRGWQRGEKEI